MTLAKVLKFALYFAALVCVAAGIAILVGAINFGAGLQNSLLPVNILGLQPLISLIVGPLSRTVMSAGIILFVALESLALLMALAAGMVNRSITLEERVARLESLLRQQSAAPVPTHLRKSL